MIIVIGNATEIMAQSPQAEAPKFLMAKMWAHSGHILFGVSAQKRREGGDASR